jgi:hypothetical protein
MAGMHEELDRHLAAAPDAGTDLEALAKAIHAQHVEEFDFMKGDRWSDPVSARECGHCQQWARYAHAALATHDAALIAAAEARGAAEADERIARAIENATVPREGGLDVEIGHREGLRHAARIARVAPATDRTEATPGGGSS